MRATSTGRGGAEGRGSHSRGKTLPTVSGCKRLLLEKAGMPGVRDDGTANVILLLDVYYRLGKTFPSGCVYIYISREGNERMGRLLRWGDGVGAPREPSPIQS